TADSTTRQEIKEKLGLQNAEQYISSFDRPNIRYRVTLKNNPKKQLLDFIRWEQEDNSGIVYCLSRKKVEDIASWLTDHGYIALPYHAGLDSEVRLKHQRRFLQEEGIIIVATIAFGMGIDKPDVRFVAHLDLPKSIEAYYQETGRAGRDGEKATAWMAYSLADVVLLRKMLEGSDAGEQQKWIEKRKLDSLLGYCETSDCRRQVMLNYFGEKLEKPCDNCDTCLEPVETWEGGTAAQKALSCVYRTGQRFGARYLIDILLGNSNERITKLGHDRLSTFGIGTELSQAEWQSVFRQLIASDLLSIDIKGYGGFSLTEKSRPVLKGEQKVKFRKDPIPEKTLNKPSKQKIKQIELHGPDDLKLWEKLRELRKQLSSKQKIPAYLIFHDSTLKEMVEMRPQSLREMERISGVGQTKLDRYGKSFLKVITDSGSVHN
ncbi:ATP-dependent DNA helicase, partial [bacterium]|nr:ATP-dependent DNA helicase [bacterium]